VAVLADRRRDVRGSIVAALAMSVHKRPPPPEVLSIRDYMENELRGDDGKVPKHIATDVLALIDRLQEWQ
jgi:hypothetical protein